MADAYNNMVERSCDPQIRRRDGLEAIEVTPLLTRRRLQPGCKNFEGRFLVTGTARKLPSSLKSHAQEAVATNNQERPTQYQEWSGRICTVPVSAYLDY